MFDISNAEQLKELERLRTECEIAFSVAVEPKEIWRLHRLLKDIDRGIERLIQERSKAS
jgi:hypothetical protein